MSSEPLDWQLQCTQLKQRCSYLYHSGQWSDCSFLVGSEPEQVCVPAHKLILAMASPVFEAMFYGGMAKENNDLIPILDVEPEAFKAMFEYIYSDNINITSIGMAYDLYYGAKKYMLPHLVEECSRYLLTTVNPTNACRTYMFAKLFRDTVLIEKSLQTIKTKTKEVLADSSFEDVDLDTMVMVFSLEDLNVDSELDLFEAVLRYRKAQDKRPPSPEPTTGYEKVVNADSSADSSLEAGVGEPRRAEPKPGPSSADMCPETPKKLTIRSAIEKIRFLTLTPEQFLRGPDSAQPPLLTPSESHAVLKHIILRDNPTVPLPRGFSESRLPRKLDINSLPCFNDDAHAAAAREDRHPAAADTWLACSPHAPPPALRRRSPASFRRNVYQHNLWARPMPDFSGRFRDCSPEFYRDNDSQMHRLVPWLTRELHILLYEDVGLIKYVLARILELLKQYRINSAEFTEAMQRYFGDRTEHFLHELHGFASTPYDINRYDLNVQYTTDTRISPS